MKTNLLNINIVYSFIPLRDFTDRAGVTLPKPEPVGFTLIFNLLKQMFCGKTDMAYLPFQR